MSEVVNIPQLRFPEFNGGWKESRIGKIYKDLRTGSTPSRAVKSYFKGDNPWITSGELKYNRISTTFEQISDEAIKDTNLVLYQPGTLFIAITGLEAPGTRGKCAINAVPSTTNQSCLAFRKVDSVDTIYMFYWYLKYGKPLYFKYAQGTKQQSFNNKIVEKFQIFLPNKPEQQKIAAFLSAVDNKIEQLSKKQELLGEYKKGLMQQIFSQAIRFKADDGCDFPDWEEKSLGELFNYKNGGSFENEVVKDGLYNLITLNSITIDGELKNEHKKINSFDNSLKINDLIMVLSDVAHGNFLGLTAIIPEDNSYVLNQRMGALKSKGLNNVVFLRLLINYNQKYFKLHGQGSSQQNLSKGDILKFELLLPNRNEQQKIANFLSSIDTKIEQVGKQLDESKQFKKALLQQMFV
jgi:type I restriction enzyme S subunit